MTIVVLAGAVALCTGTLVVALTCFTGPSPTPPFGLTWSAGFRITSTISSTPTPSYTPAVLYPGAQRYLWYTAHNPLKVPITVTSMSIAAVMPPAGCPTSNLDTSHTTFSGSLVVPASGANSVSVPISLLETHTNQDTCENTTFHFVYSGKAVYTDTTSTALMSSPNASVSGSLVTFTATVVPTGTPPGNPTGTVNFYQCATAACSGTPTLLGSGSLGPFGIAKYSTSSLAVGTDFIEAIYQGASTDFFGSTSNVVSQVVNLTTTTTVLGSSPNPSVSGHLVNFTATVTADSASPTGTVNFYSCPSVSCASTTLLGTGTIGAGGQAMFSTSGLPVGTTYVEAVYLGTSNFSGSTSNVVTQVVTSASVGTATTLSSTPNPSSYGTSVTFTATVTPAQTGAVSGTVSFYSCATTACTTKSLLGTGTVGTANKATFSISSLPIGTTIVEAVYSGSTTYLASTSNTVSQVVTLAAATTVLGSSPNPSVVGSPVTLSATVTKSSGSATLTGTVSFYLGTPTGTHSLLGTGTVSLGLATLVTSSLPAGTDSLYAVYSGDSNFSGSTSPVISEVVIGPPPSCTGSYTNTIFGNPFFPVINGTNGNDFIYAFGGDYLVNGFDGNDCLDAGDGNNFLTDGNGNDVVLAGNGDNTVVVGNGEDAVTVGNGSNAIGAGKGNDSVTVGSGSHNGVILGSGTDTVTVQGGSYDQIIGGAGNETVYLGTGIYNTYNGAAHHTNVCHLPTPPASWQGTAASYYHDSITNCTVVTP
jgi:Ca2+-binding RTX toxin-like protein